MDGGIFGRGGIEGGDVPPIRREIDPSPEYWPQPSYGPEFDDSSHNRIIPIDETSTEIFDDVPSDEITSESSEGNSSKTPKIEAGFADLTVGRPDNRGAVTVEKAKVDLNAQTVVIDESAAVQITVDGQQINEYRFELEKPVVSIDKVFGENLAARRTFARMVEHPNSWFAYYAFRRTLRERPLFSGEIKSEKLSESKVTRIPLHPDSGGVIARNTKGVQIGLNGRQFNVFKYKLVNSEMFAETALRGSRRLARCLAVAASNPDFEAARRSLDRQLEQMNAEISGRVDEKLASYANLSEVNITGHGIQIGSRNERIDKVFISVKEFSAKGLESVRSGERGSAEGLKREERLSRRHTRAIADSRPPGLPTPRVGQFRACSLSKVIGEASTTALNHAAPGRNYLAAQTTENMETALDNLRPFTRGGAGELSGYLVPGGGEFRLFPRAGRSPSLVPPTVGYPPADDRKPQRTTGRAPGHPEVKLVTLSPLNRRPEQSALGDRVPREHDSPPERSRLSPAQPGSGTAAPQPGGGSTSRQGEPPGRDTDARAVNEAAEESTVHATAAVVWGSVAEIAAAEGTRFLDAGVLLGYVRRRLWRDRNDKRPRSVKPVLQAIRRLQVIIFLDPSIGGGLWVDVDPQRYVPAATSLIKMDLSAGPPVRFTVFTQAG